LERFARVRDGIVTTAELRGFGVGKDAVTQRVANGRLHRIHQGVYVLGRRAVSQRGRWRAAVAAYGPGALLSRLSSAGLWELLDDERSVVDVTTTSARCSRRGIIVHQARDLTDADRAVKHGIPLTAVARTLVGIAGVVPVRTLEKAVRAAERKSLLDVEAALALCVPGRRGAEALREILGRDFGPALGTRSELELRFLELCEGHGLPMPAVNVWVEGLLVDAIWPAQRLIVELDGFEFHRTRADQRRDAERDRRLTLAGYAVLRFGWHDVVGQPGGTAQAILELLHHRGG
jgi:Protein of unknown function (DUF559)/Transcriptional regulator, AbiEi antitoxin